MTYLKGDKIEIEIIEQSATQLILRKGKPKNLEAPKRIRSFIRAVIFYTVVLAIFWFFLGQDVLQLIRLNVQQVATSEIIYQLGLIGMVFGVPILIVYLPLFYQLLKPFSEIWVFDGIRGEFSQKVQNAVRNKRICYQISNILEVAINERTSLDNEISYELILNYQEGKKRKQLLLNRTPFLSAEREKAIARQKQREIALAISQFLESQNRSVSLQDSASGDETIPDPVNLKKEVGNVFQEFKEIWEISQSLKRNDYSAIEKLKAAIQENPNDSESYKQLGMILAAQGKRQGAILYLERAKELFEDQGNTEQAEFMNQIIRNLIK